jgi:hypothetical protein
MTRKSIPVAPTTTLRLPWQWLLLRRATLAIYSLPN